MPPPAPGRIVFRCDGNAQIGAGHVARCAPLAAAFAELGSSVRFVGTYEGVAARLLARARILAGAPDRGAPCGVDPHECDAAIVDSYAIESTAICALAGAVPVVTLAESSRFPTRGILLDYHIDRTEPPGPRLLPGPSFAPLDPGFAGAGRASQDVQCLLLTVGGSSLARHLLGELVSIVGATYPDAELLVAGCLPEAVPTSGKGRVIDLPSSVALVDVVSDVDIAITAAGLTAYEMACAGIPQVAIAIVPNQRRVVEGLRKSGLAPCLDLTDGDSMADLPLALEQLRDPGSRQRLAEAGRRVFDGQGARRAACALSELFRAGGAREPAPRAARGPGS
jgi:spore coat polysaccharide biosynthesis predicted glycosyltransferase SpsG